MAAQISIAPNQRGERHRLSAPRPRHAAHLIRLRGFRACSGQAAERNVVVGRWDGLPHVQRAAGLRMAPGKVVAARPGEQAVHDSSQVPGGLQRQHAPVPQLEGGDLWLRCACCHKVAKRDLRIPKAKVPPDSPVAAPHVHPCDARVERLAPHASLGGRQAPHTAPHPLRPRRGHQLGLELRQDFAGQGVAGRQPPRVLAARQLLLLALKHGLSLDVGGGHQ
mmetsp:Transcript_10406/g.29645  ORF Transcript_10406/g.29645 Transcript_10406/m.29645 type:complete len:222 (-) Transcript_10406:1630-2295(-)